MDYTFNINIGNSGNILKNTYNLEQEDIDYLCGINPNSSGKFITTNYLKRDDIITVVKKDLIKVYNETHPCAKRTNFVKFQGNGKLYKD